MAGKHKSVANSHGQLKVFILAGVGCMAIATLNNAQPRQQTQTKNAIVISQTKFEYEVASIKPNKSGSGHISMTGADDGFTATNFPLQRLVLMAFGIQEDRLFGLPNWVTTENFDIEAKMESSVADAYNKLSPNDRPLVRQQMIQ